MSSTGGHRLQPDLPSPIEPNEFDPAVVDIVMAAAAQQNQIADVGGAV